MTRAGLTFALLLITLSPVAVAHAQIDFHRGPLLTSSRITGMGGAYTSVAEGVDGYVRNPAAIANRNAQSTTFFDLGLAFDLQTTTNDTIDFDNDGATLGSESKASSALLGARIALGPFALGALYSIREFSATNGGSFTIAELAGVTGLALFEGALVVGGGVGVRWLDLNRSQGETVATEMSSLFVDVGVLYRPVHSNLRIGARFRPAASASDEVVVGMAGRPTTLTARYPWEANLGISYMVPFGERARNESIGGFEGWNVDRTILDQRYVLFSADLVADGAVANSINPEGFLCGSASCSRRSGDKVSFGAHLGVESEIIHDRLRLRVGSYTEPDRTNRLDGRLHFTGGADLRLFNLWILPIKIGAAFDLAPRYMTLQLGIGFWT